MIISVLNNTGNPGVQKRISKHILSVLINSYISKCI